MSNYNDYAKNMIDTFVKFWPDDINLIVYLDQDIALPDRVEVRAFPEWFPAWRARHVGTPDASGRDPARNRKGREVYDFRRDCLRFSYKVAAITDAYWRRPPGGLLVWMDADIVTYKAVTRDWLEPAINPRNTWMSWIDRIRPYPDCCFMAWDMASQNTRTFFHTLHYTYADDDVFGLPETHDSYVIEHIVNAGGLPAPRSLSNRVAFQKHHPFPYIELGKRMDHLKGTTRKQLGRSIERGSR